jgi:uncharacterized membrane protein
MHFTYFYLVIKKRNKWELGLLLIWLLGVFLLVGVWYYYNAQLKEINHSIEQLNKKL